VSPQPALRCIDLTVVTGMSGSGKTTAVHALEDRGLYCIDNLPTELVLQFATLCSESSEKPSRVGLGIDLRDASYVARWPGVRAELEALGHHVFVVFLDCNESTLLTRFSETRRPHLLAEGRDLAEAIATERTILAPLKTRADIVLDTTDLTVHDLKRRISEICVGEGADRGPEIKLKSFGFKHGPVRDADMVFDVRFIPNPHFVENLRAGTGLDQPVAAYVLERDVTQQFLRQVMEQLDFLLPLFKEEGKSYLTVAVGCTGGHHRSVAITEELGRRLGQHGLTVTVRHRDIER
jgi:UPF0042 nucleotide-binding protein